MERKTVTATAKFIISAWNTGLFAIVWYLVYSRWIFEMHAEIAYVISLLIYYIINTYHAFKLASSSVPELIFNQVVSFGIADLVLYLVCCIGVHGYARILPGFITVCMQFAGSAVMIIVTKRYFVKHITPEKTVIVYGCNESRESAAAFGARLSRKYQHIFFVEEMIEEQDDCVEERIKGYQTVIIFEVSALQREQLIKICCEAHKKFYYTPSISDLVNQGSSYKQLLDTPLMKYDYSFDSVSPYGLKRVLDIVLSLIFLRLLSPLFIIVALGIVLEDHGPVFYRQKRCTIGGRVFPMIKFRSMVVDAEKNGILPCTDKDPRVTRVGKFIRAHRIDELPQLFNILRGDMSFVGPRPERVEHVEQYTRECPEFAYRMRVKGGLTGYAQIYGKYNTSAYDKLRWDLMYIENQSIIEDIKIVMLTLRVLFKKESTEGFDVTTSTMMNLHSKEN